MMANGATNYIKQLVSINFFVMNKGTNRRLYHIVIDHAFQVKSIITYHRISKKSESHSDGYLFQSITHILSMTLRGGTFPLDLIYTRFNQYL